MPDLSPHLSIFPLGDAAVTLDLGNHIDEQLNKKALAIQAWLEAHRVMGIRDIVVAYSSVSVFYDPVVVRSGMIGFQETAYSFFKRLLEDAFVQSMSHLIDNQYITEQEENRGLIRIPVSYGGQFGPDLSLVAEQQGISAEDVIQLHSGRVYRVYMIGFLPGFSYLGRLDERLNIPRKVIPVPVLAGGVGIAGNQTGIYPLNSPGGWQIIGRTPVRLFDPVAEIPVRLKAGDRVQFFAITKNEYLDTAAIAR